MAATIHPPGTAPSIRSALAKAPTGIRGFDELTGGGLPHGRATLVTGGPGSCKTLFGLEFLVRGAQEFDEPGVLLAFEESAADLTENVASLGFDLAGLEADGRLVIDAVRIDASEIVTTGDFDLDGLFIRLASAVQSVGARRVVLDTIEVLFGALGDEAIVRGRVQPAAAVAEGPRAHHGDHRRARPRRAADPVRHRGVRLRLRDRPRSPDARRDRHPAAARREVPRLAARHERVPLPGHRPRACGSGRSPRPRSTYAVSTERVSLGVPQLDEMLGGGVYRGSTVLVTGTAGTGKTTLAASAVDAACARGESALFVSFEESPDQIIRNMRSVGIDLGGGWTRGCCGCGASGRPPSASRRTSRRSSGCSRRPNRPSPSSTRSAASAMSARRRK